MIIENEDINRASTLAGVVVDAGHGGEDPGASGNGIIEKDLTLKISQYMADRFRALGVPVTLIRNTDETLTPEERVARVLNAYGNNSNVIVISNHINSGGGEGSEIIYALRDNDTFAKTIANELAKTGQTVRKWYQRRLPSDTSKDYYFMLRNTGQTEPVIVEYGFLDNATDATFLKNNWQRLAEAVVKAVAIYKNIPYQGMGGTNYTVQSGDTLWSIAKKLGVSVNDLKAVNNLTTNNISVGQVLTVPGIIPPSGGETYTVKSGDNLYSIASKYNITVDALKATNNLTSNTLSIGQVLTIPSVNPPSINTYTVVSGDNLYSIAQRFGVSVSQLRAINNLTTDVLNIGQTLIIPTQQPVTGTTYTVVSGDNLYSIANKYGVTIDTLKAANNLTNNTLSVGQILTIPASTTPTPSGTVTYTVQSGDNLYSIANKYGITVDALKVANKLTANTLSIGQVLTIPGTSSSAPTETKTYIVVKGDSLYNIAQKFNTTANELISLNNLSSNLLTIGQVLTLPGSSNTRSIDKNYVVKSGDSLSTIAEQFNVTKDEIRMVNNLSTDILIIGQELKMP